MSKDVRSAPDLAQGKNLRDRRGDKYGVLEPAPKGGDFQRDAIISIRWVQQAIQQTAREIADPRDAEEPESGKEFLERLKEDALHLEHDVAVVRAFPLLWHARRGRVRAGELIDAADLYITGRYGTIEQIIAGLISGKFNDIERDSEGFIRGVWPGHDAE